METLGIIGAVIGIVTGLIAIYEKIWGGIFHRNEGKSTFRKLYREWKHDHITTPEPAQVRRFSGYISQAKLDQDKLAFALQAVLYTGDAYLHEMLLRNQANPKAIQYLVPRLTGPGIRAAWRTEYALTQLPAEQTLQEVVEDDTATPAMRAAAQRVLDHSVIDHLRIQAAGDDQKLRAYADEVLQQIGELLRKDKGQGHIPGDEDGDNRPEFRET